VERIQQKLAEANQEGVLRHEDLGSSDAPARSRRCCNYVRIWRRTTRCSTNLALGFKTGCDGSRQRQSPLRADSTGEARAADGGVPRHRMSALSATIESLLATRSIDTRQQMVALSNNGKMQGGMYSAATRTNARRISSTPEWILSVTGVGAGLDIGVRRGRCRIRGRIVFPVSENRVRTCFDARKPDGSARATTSRRSNVERALKNAMGATPSGDQGGRGEFPKRP